MDIEAWVEHTQEKLHAGGQERLAELLDAVPAAVHDEDEAAVEALVAEGLTLAHGLPWVELFLRHWRLEAVAGGLASLPEALDLHAFAADHPDCPQSVCAVQDLTIAYGGADGPGYAQERLALADAALARIDPSWPCHACLTDEKMAALIDAGRAVDALALGPSLEGLDAEALLELGFAEEALERLPDDDEPNRWRELRRAWALVALGREEEALDALPPLDEVLLAPLQHYAWARVAAVAEENDWYLGATLERMLAAQVERGITWHGTLLAELAGQLALERDAPATAQRALATMRGLAARLRDPERAADRLAALEAAVAAAPTPRVELPGSVEELIEELEASDDPDPEQDLARLEASRRQWPDSLDVAVTYSSALDSLGRPGEALGVLRAFAGEHGSDVAAQQTYAYALIETLDLDEARAMAERIEPLDALEAEWIRAQAAFVAGDMAAAREHAEHVFGADPDARGARRLFARAAEVLGDFAAALEQREAVLQTVPEDEREDAEWDLLVPATALGDWDAVRAAGERLDLEFDTQSGPVEEAWGMIRLSFGARDEAVGMRSGPVSARVLTVALPGEARVQRAGDLVVFDAEPVDDDEEMPLFEVVAVLAEGPRRVYPFDGVYPGEDEWVTLAATLVDDGWVVHPRVLDGYEIEVDDEPRPGIFGAFAVPHDVSDAEAHARLTELTASWDEPFTWLPLAEAAGDTAAADEQRAIALRLDLY